MDNSRTKLSLCQKALIWALKRENKPLAKKDMVELVPYKYLTLGNALQELRKLKLITYQKHNKTWILNEN